MQKIVLASNNAGKAREIGRVLADLDVEIVPQSAFQAGEIEETGLSFVENALLKARHAAHLSGLPALADDSGIEVDALDGAPGIYSARYGGPDADDRMNNEKLIEAMQDVPDAGRGARFQCVIVLMRRPLDSMPLICTGSWEGRILREPRGRHGFGYDPLFYVPTHDCASAELDPDVKNRISHRAQALQLLKRSLCSHQYHFP